MTITSIAAVSGSSIQPIFSEAAPRIEPGDVAPAALHRRANRRVSNAAPASKNDRIIEPIARAIPRRAVTLSRQRSQPRRQQRQYAGISHRLGQKAHARIVAVL